MNEEETDTETETCGSLDARKTYKRKNTTSEGEASSSGLDLKSKSQKLIHFVDRIDSAEQ